MSYSQAERLKKAYEAQLAKKERLVFRLMTQSYRKERSLQQMGVGFSHQ